MELLEGHVLCGEDGGENVSTVGCEGVAMSGVDFADETVGPKHAEHTRDFGGAASFFFWRIGGRIEEELLEVAIAEAVD